MSQDQTLQQLLTERVSIFAQSERPREIIDEHVEKLFTSVIGDCFRSHGELGMAVKESIKKSLPANVDGMFELTRYNDLISTALHDKWASSGVAGDMVRRAQEAIDEILKEDAVPAQVSLRDLLEAFVEAHKEQAIEERWEAPRIDFKEKALGTDMSWIWISFDAMPDEAFAQNRSSYSGRSGARSAHMLSNNLAVNVEGTNEKGHKFGRVISAKLDGNPLGRKFRIYSKWQRLLAALYFGAATLVIDCDGDDISYGLYD